MKLRIFLLLTLLGVFSGRAQTAGVTNLWQFRLPGGTGDSSPALAPDGTVYSGFFYGWLVALTPEGQLKWKFKAGREIQSSPAVAADGTIYFGSRDWNCYALTPAGKLKWKFATGAWVDSSPALAADGTIYFGSHDGNFYALTPAGKLKWKFATGAEIVSSPALGGAGTIYFTSTDGHCYALNPDGTERWRRRTGGFTPSSPVLDPDGNLYLCINKAMASISREGKIRWQNNSHILMDGSPAVAGNGEIYFSHPWTAIGGFQTNGVLAWSFDLKNSLAGSPNVDARGIIYASNGQDIMALQPLTQATPPARSSWPVWRGNPQHTGQARAAD